MKFKFKGLAIALMMVVLIAMSVAVVSAGGPQAADEVVDAVDRASLVRTDKGLSLTLKASGLTEGNTVTAWWLVDSSKNGSAAPPDPGDVVCNVAGHRVGASGTFNVGSHLGLNEPENVCFVAGDPDKPPVIEDTDVFVEIHVVDHGPQTLTGEELVKSMNDFMTGSDCCSLVGIAKFNAVP